MGEGFPALFFLSSAAVAVEERFWGFNLCIPFIRGEGSGGPPPEKFGKSGMQEKPSTTFFRLILYIFIFH